MRRMFLELTLSRRYLNADKLGQVSDHDLKLMDLVDRRQSQRLFAVRMAAIIGDPHDETDRTALTPH